MDTTTSLLKDRDYTLIVDKSGSMSTSDTPRGSRWQYVKETTLALANKLSELDSDGITFYAFNDRFKRHENVTPAIVDQVWAEHEPMGGTNLAWVLNHAFDSYFSRKQQGQTKPNGEIMLIVTDGVPNDEEAVRQSIIHASKRMTVDEELGLSFIQVGKDAHATTFLKQLDDGLVAKGAKFDIVDTVNADDLNDRPLIDVLISAITD